MCTNKMSNIGMRNGKEEGRRGREGKEREGRQRRGRRGREGKEREREGREFHSTIPSNRHSNQLTELAKKKLKLSSFSSFPTV